MKKLVKENQFLGDKKRSIPPNYSVTKAMKLSNSFQRELNLIGREFNWPIIQSAKRFHQSGCSPD